MIDRAAAASLTPEENMNASSTTPRERARAGSGSTTVRRFTPDHIPDVMRLRRAMLRASERPDDAALADHYARVFFASPWNDASMPSLVALESGRLVGFIGVLPRPFTFRGEAITAAISTDFMVHPECQGMAAVLLLQAYLRAGQDISFADRANERARLVFEAVGGSMALWFSLYWTLPVRKVRHALAQVDGGRVLRPVFSMARRAAAVIDQALPRTAESPAPLNVEPLAADEVAEILPQALAPRCDLFPMYDGHSLAWLLDRVSEKATYGVLDAFQLRAGRDLAGWCIMLVRSGGRAEVVQWAAARGHHRAVLDCALSRAAQRGAVTLAGRLDPAFAAPLTDLRVPFTLGQPFTLVHTRRPELLEAVMQGRAFFSRLDGEWWLST